MSACACVSPFLPNRHSAYANSSTRKCVCRRVCGLERPRACYEGSHANSKGFFPAFASATPTIALSLATYCRRRRRRTPGGLRKEGYLCDINRNGNSGDTFLRALGIRVGRVVYICICIQRGTRCEKMNCWNLMLCGFCVFLFCQV